MTRDPMELPAPPSLPALPARPAPPSPEEWARRVKETLKVRAADEAARADRYQVVGPTAGTGNLVILDAGRCVATVKYNPDNDAECRKRAARLARADVRTYVLKHLLAELETADEGTWQSEIDMLRAELKASGDDDD